MELIRGLHNLRGRHRGCVLTIGNFDGLHRGHQVLIARTLERSRELGLPATVLTFNPTPREYFARGDAPPRVLTLRSKLAALAQAGLDRCVVARFSRALAGMGAREFVDELLVKRFGAAAVIVGHDFCYGRGRQGTQTMLRDEGALLGFAVDVLDKVEADGERCSSTALREALAAPDLARVERLLGRRYSVLGRVRRGLRLGRQLGMPTANIELTRPLALREGVYAVRGRVGERWWNGVASIGVRPTLGLTRCLLETHLFDDGEPCGEIYGQNLEVEFHAWLRPQLKFASLDELSARMQLDAGEARRLLAP